MGEGLKDGSVFAPPTAQESSAAQRWHLKDQRWGIREEEGKERMEIKENRTVEKRRGW